MSSPPEDRSVLVADKWWSKLPRPAYKNLKRVPISSEWFEVYLVGRDTYVIYEPGQYEEAISTLVMRARAGRPAATGISGVLKECSPRNAHPAIGLNPASETMSPNSNKASSYALLP
jgi:hypothetical protein